MNNAWLKIVPQGPGLTPLIAAFHWRPRMVEADVRRARPQVVVLYVKPQFARVRSGSTENP